MAIIKSGVSEIIQLNQNGEGVFIDDLKRQTMPYTIPGENISYDLHSYRKQSNYVLNKILDPSPHRVNPACQYFTICGGCKLQHLSKSSYNDFKKSMVEKRVSTLFPKCRIEEVVEIGEESRRRLRLTLLKKTKGTYLGFKKFHSDKIVDINNCPAATKRLSNLITPLKKFFEKMFSVGIGIVHLTEADNGIDLLTDYRFSIDDCEILNQQITDFCKKNNIIRFSYINNKEKKIVLYESDYPFVIFGKTQVNISADSFLQPTKSSDLILPKIVESYLGLSQNLNIVDIFCGRGTFAFHLCEIHKIVGFDIDADAIRALNESVKKYKKSVISFQRDLFKKPLTSSELGGFNLVIINPPRSGARPQIQELAKTFIDIIYISCDLESFIDDAKILKNNNCTLSKITPVDQFHWSASIEVIAYFSKK